MLSLVTTMQSRALGVRGGSVSWGSGVPSAGGSHVWGVFCLGGLPAELQKRADRADQSVLIYPGRC